MKSALVGVAAAVTAGIIAGMGAIAPVLAQDGLGRALVAANVEQILDAPAQASHQAIRRAFIPPYSGTVRVKWDAKSKDGTVVVVAVAVKSLDSCSQQTTSTAYVSQSCDLRVTGGMPVMILASPDDSANTAYLKNLSLNYKVINSRGETVAGPDENR